MGDRGLVRNLVSVVAATLLTGCGVQPAKVTATVPEPATAAAAQADDVEADIRILFVGNSHTTGHDLPNLVCKMIQFQQPEKAVRSRVVSVAFLEDAARNPELKHEIASRRWNVVVLQAQKISMSGRFDYSRKEGIDIAKQAKDTGAAVYFFSEWARRGVEDEGRRTEKIYQAMAEAAGGFVVPIGAAWDLAFDEQPDLTLHEADGNHESALGTFLTACVLTGQLTGENPEGLAAFPYLSFNERDRAFLAQVAARTLAVRRGRNGQ
jgi:hypothetical protein